jgi:hypothetical protein
MSREDYEARELLWEAASLIEERWPGTHPNLVAELESLIKEIGEQR